MAIYFFDSSAIVKHYVHETGTAWINEIIDPSKGNTIYLARITGVEMVSAIIRRKRNNRMLALQADAAIAKLKNDLDNEYQLVEMNAILLSEAMSLAEKHALRGYDAVQLAAALEVNHFSRAAGFSGLTLISADTALNDAALMEGLSVDDPNNH